MAVNDKRLQENDEMLASRQAFWSGFVKFSTWSIVGIALLMLLGAVFLL